MSNNVTFELEKYNGEFNLLIDHSLYPLDCDELGNWSVKIDQTLYTGSTPNEILENVKKRYYGSEEDNYNRGFNEGYALAVKDREQLTRGAFNNGYKQAMGDIASFAISKGKKIKDEVEDRLYHSKPKVSQEPESIKDRLMRIHPDYLKETIPRTGKITRGYPETNPGWGIESQ